MAHSRTGRGPLDAARPSAGQLGLALIIAALLVGCAPSGAPDQDPAPTPPSAAPAASVSAEPDPSGWRRLPDGPLSGRTDSVVVGLDDTAYVIGGWEMLCPPGADCRTPDETLVDGAAVDLVTGEWRRIADAPVPVSHGPPAVLGGEIYVRGRDRLLRYDPGADTWRDLGRMPGTVGELVPWGDELVGVAGSDEGGERRDHVFDPDSGRWRLLPDDPLPRGYDRFIVADGGRLVLAASPMVGPESEGGAKMVAIHSPRTGRWTRWPDAPGGGWQVWRDGDRLWLNPHVGGGGGGVLDLGSRTWGDYPAGPETPDWDGDTAGLLADGGLQIAYPGWVLDVRDGDRDWVRVAEPGAGIFDQTYAAAGSRLLAAGGQRWRRDEGELVADLWVWTPPAP